ncbi:MAG: sulfate ABC transporter substrate-binding protein [Oculatellaceae cyanobacterium Prado106]|jgi:sulfate transport system substrate-binding protein|nr:sulfate ABC transporter substrate-binding protein [Oculatellaceae cyanobacterium Prado106]
MSGLKVKMLKQKWSQFWQRRRLRYSQQNPQHKGSLFWKGQGDRFQLPRFLTAMGFGLLLTWMTTGLTACLPVGASTPIEVTLVSFAVTRAAYENIIPQFEAKWQQEHGQTVSFSRSYGGSGSQTRAVIDGLQADIVALALALDVDKIQANGLIQPGWEDRTPNRGIVHQSVAALVTRPGNPKNIQTWQDLAQDQIQVVTANPKTSGGARWNFLGIWGAITATGGDETAALNFTTEVFKHAPVLPRDAREATDVFFKQGQGDVLINYENEVILAQQNGQELPYLIPNVNISIDSPITLVDEYVDKHGTREVATAFIEYLFTPEAQREFAKVGFRPVNPTVSQEFAAQYPKVDRLFTVQDLGGWSKVQKQFFADKAIFDQIQANVGKR